MPQINLNLLKSLDALLTTQNVSRAGERVGVTQSAMSIVLKQLRDIFEDDLLTRGHQGQMQLTTFASTLIQPVKEALRQSEAVFTSHIPFSPATSMRSFHIGMSDYIAFRLLPKLMQQITHHAPNIKIVQHAINHLDSTQPFDNLRLDIAIGDFHSTPKSLKTIKLFSDKGIIVADKKHPAFKEDNLTLKEFLKYPQVFVALESQPEKNFILEMLTKMGHKVKVSLITPHTLIALQALPDTLLMTNTVENLAMPFIKTLGLDYRKTPYELREFNAQMYWHSRDQNDQGHQWLRQFIKKIATTN